MSDYLTMKNNLEEVWSSEFYDWYYENSQIFKGYSIPTRDFRLIYIEARKKSQEKIEQLEQELQKTRDQLEKAEKRIFHLGECSSLWEYQGICGCGYEQYFKDKQGE